MNVIFSVLSAAVIYTSPVMFTTDQLDGNEHCFSVEMDTTTISGSYYSLEKKEIKKAAAILLRKQILAEAAWAMTISFLRQIISGQILKILMGLILTEMD
jgi:hypothetical protein